MVSSYFLGSNNCFTTRVNRYRDNTQIIFVAFRDFVNKGLMPIIDNAVPWCAGVRRQSLDKGC